MNTLINTLLVGGGATAIVDLWSLVRHRWLGVSPPNYALLGRWIGHMPHGRFRHAAIGASAPIQGERTIGWAAHYLIGIAFAALLPSVWGPTWFRTPTLLPALVVGIATVAAPFLLMQPGMGAGLAARHTPHPAATRAQSLITHAIFGLGLYLAAQATSFLIFDA